MSLVASSSVLAQQPVLLLKFDDRTLQLGPKDFKDVLVMHTPLNGYAVMFELSDMYREKFAKATFDHIGKKVQIILCDIVVSELWIQSEIPGGRAQIGLGHSDQQVRKIAEALRSGDCSDIDADFDT